MSDTMNLVHAIKGGVTGSTQLPATQFDNIRLLQAIENFEARIKVPGFKLTPLEYMGFLTLVKLYEANVGPAF